MTCSSKTPLNLNIYCDFESRDDDKTPEYPLSDDHPLSLIHRAKLLNSYKSNAKCEMDSTSSPKNNMSLNRSNTVIDSATGDGCRTPDGHFVSASQPECKDFGKKYGLQSMCDALYGVMDEEKPEMFGKMCNRKRFTEALDLASGFDAEFTNQKAHFFNRNVSVCVRSIIDYFMGGDDVASTLCSSDNNNNSGQPPLHCRKDKKELHTSIHKHNFSNHSIRAASHELPPNDTLNDENEISVSVYGYKHKCSSADSLEFNNDIEDKNTPPQLSPINSFTANSQSTQSPIVPPILRPLKADARRPPLSSELFYVLNDSQGRKPRGNVNVTTKKKIELLSMRPNMEVSSDDSVWETENFSPNGKSLDKTDGPNVPSNPLNSSLIKKDGNELEETCKDPQGQSPKWNSNEVPRVSIENANGWECSNCLSRCKGGSNMHDCPTLESEKCSSLNAFPSRKSPTGTISVHNDKSKIYNSPSTIDNSTTVTLKIVSMVTEPKSTQMFLSTEAKSVTSGDTTLCYPYSTQKSLTQVKISPREQPFSFNGNASAVQNVPAAHKSSPVKISVSSTPSFSLPLSSVSFMSSSSSRIREFPTSMQRRSAGAQFSPIFETEKSRTLAHCYERVTAAVATTAGHIRAIDIHPSLHNSTYPSDISAKQVQNVVFSTNEGQQQTSLENYFVFAEWSEPSPEPMDSLRREKVPHFSNNLEVHSKAQTATSDQMTCQRYPQGTEIEKSIIEQEKRKIGVSSEWKIADVQSLRDISSKSNLSNKKTAHQLPVPILKENVGLRQDNVSLRKFEQNCIGQHGTPSSAASGTGQSEPLDLTRKSTPLHSTASTLCDVMRKSTVKIPPFARHNSHENEKDSVLGHKTNNLLSDGMTLHPNGKLKLNEELINSPNGPKNANKVCYSERSLAADRLIENWGKDCKIIRESRSRIRSPSILQQEETNVLSLPNEPNLVIDLEDSRNEPSPLKSPKVQESRKGLSQFSVDNYYSLNPDEKSYSRLAFAAITSQRKKSLARCIIPSENEDFLDFLRPDASIAGLKVGEKSDATLFSQLRNGDYIDLTEDKDDVLSVSSDENMTVLYIPDNMSDGKNGNTSSHGHETEETMEMFTTESCPSRKNDGVKNTFRSINLLHNGEIEDLSEMPILTNHQLDVESCRGKATCDAVAEEEEKGYQQMWHCPPSAEFDEAKWSIMKEQSLTFSPSQKARMAKKIEDIIKSNSKLLPEDMQQSSSGLFNATASNISKRIQEFESEAGPSPSTLPSSETGHSNPSRAIYFPENQNSFTQHLKMKRSLSLEDGPATFVHPHQRDTVLRCNSVTDRHSNSYLNLSPIDSAGERAYALDPMSSPRNDELNSVESSPYKTVWQTQFFTERPSNYVGKDGRCTADKSFPINGNNEDLVQRLELLHDAANSLNQASHTHLNKATISGENWNSEEKRMQNVTNKMVRGPGNSSNEIFIDPLSHSLRSDSQSHMDNVHMLPSVSEQFNQFIPSTNTTIVVAPYYAMTYPLCYPALQRASASNQPILFSHHNGPLDVVENRFCWPNKRKRTRKAKSDGRSKRKKSRKAIRSDNVPILNTNENERIEDPQRPSQTLLETDLNPVDVTKMTKDVQNCLNANANESAIIDTGTQSSANLQGSHSPGRHHNFEEILAADNCSYLLQTRKEDGLTILSMQCTGEYESSGHMMTSINKQGDQSCSSIQNNSQFDHNPSTSFSARVDSSYANSWDLSNLNKSVLAQPVNAVNPIGQNLATLALASEAHVKMQNPTPFKHGTAKTNSTDFNPQEMNDHTRTSMSSTHSPLHDSEISSFPGTNDTAQSQIQISKATQPDDEQHQHLSMVHGITEKEKLVTEILAAMMQNRKSTSVEKPSYRTNTDFL